MGMQWGFLRLGLLRSEKKQLVILHDISSLLAPGRFTLLLGPPASGKSTLLKLLAGKLQRGSGLDVRTRKCYPTLPFAMCPHGGMGTIDHDGTTCMKWLAGSSARDLTMCAYESALLFAMYPHGGMCTIDHDGTTCMKCLAGPRARDLTSVSYLLEGVDCGLFGCCSSCSVAACSMALAWVCMHGLVSFARCETCSKTHNSSQLSHLRGRVIHSMVAFISPCSECKALAWLCNSAAVIIQKTARM